MRWRKGGWIRPVFILSSPQGRGMQKAEQCCFCVPTVQLGFIPSARAMSCCDFCSICKASPGLRENLGTGRGGC